MADLNPEQLEALERLLEGFDRLTRQARTTGDIIEDKLGKRFQASMEKAMRAAEERAKAETNATLKINKNITEEQRDRAVDAAGKRAARNVQQQYNERVTQGRQTLEQLGTTATKLTRRLYQGEQGATVFAEAMDEAATAVGALTFLLGGPLIKALTVLTLGFFKLGKAASEQSDALFKSFQTLQQSGANAADGLAGVFTMMQNFSYGIEDLDKMTSMIAENAQSLAMFRGSVADGARALSGVGREIKDSGLRREFMNMGMTIPEINESIASYINLQGRLGTVQQRDIKSITSSVAAYVKETDAITRLTGATRKQQEAAQQRALNIEQFRYKYQKLMASNDPKLIAQGTKMMQTFKMLNALGPGGEQLAEAYASMQTGIVREGAALTGTLISNGQAMQIVNDQNLSAAGTVEALTRVVGNVIDPNKSGSLGDLARVGIFKEITGADYGALLDAIKAGADLEKRLAGVTSEQERLRIIQEAGVKAQVGMRIAQMDSRDSMQSFVNLGVAPATQALSTFAQVVQSVTKLLPGGANAGAPSAAVGPTGGKAGPAAAGLKGAAAKNLNPGNLRFAGQAGATMGTGGFAAFSTVDEGLVALAKQLDLYLTGKSAMGKQNTIASVISTYAPPNENKTDAYVNSVAKFMGMDPNAELTRDPKTMAKLMAAIIGYENHGDPSKGYNFRSGIQFAVAQILGVDPSQIGKFARGGITSGPSIAGEAGPEAVVPLPDGRSIPITFTDIASKKIMGGIGLSQSLAGANFGSGAMLRTDIANQIGKLVEGGQPMGETLKSTMEQFSQSMQEFTRQVTGSSQGDMGSLLAQLVELQRNQNRTSEKILQVSQN